MHSGSVSPPGADRNGPSRFPGGTLDPTYQNGGAKEEDSASVAAPVKAAEATPAHMDDDARESWDNEGGHDRAASAERPKDADPR
jgi:hypothetical protein